MKNGKLLFTLVISAAILIFVSCRETPANPDGYININGTVVNVDGSVINSAKVEAVDATDKVIATGLTSDKGIFSLSNIPANTDNVYLVVTKTGYKTLKVSLSSLLENSLDNKIVLILEKEGQNTDCCGNIHFVITDDVTKLPLNDVEVRLNQESNVIAKFMTGKEGKVDFENLCPGNYWVRVYKDGYAVIEKQITIANCDPININLPLVKSSEDPCCGVVNMMIFDKDSKQGITEVKVVLHYGDKIIETKYTDAHGVVGFTGLCMGKYWISIEHAGYKTIIQDFNVINCDPLNITFSMEKAANTDCCGKIYISLTDKTTQKRLAGREVTLYQGNVVIAKKVTSDNGEVNFTDLCVGGYAIKISAEGYKAFVYEVKVSNCDPIVLSLALEPNTTEDCCGKIVVTAYDYSSQKLLAGAEVRLTSPDGKAITYKTNDAGVVEFAHLCPGKYGLRISLAGYKVIEQAVNVENCDPINITAILQKNAETDCCGKIYFTMTDNSTQKPISGVEIRLTSSDGKVITQKTNDAGVTGFTGLCMGTYYIRISREGYKVIEKSIKVENCDPIEQTLGMDLIEQNDCCKGSLGVIVTDGATQKPIVGATVKLWLNGKEFKSAKTTDKGYAQFDGLCNVEYGVSINAEGYKGIEYKYTHPCNEKVYQNETLTKSDDCCKGVLYFSVKDDATQKAIAGATIRLWLNGTLVQNVKTTDGGYATMDGICVGDYSISINADGYKEVSYKYSQACNEKVTQAKTMVKKEVTCTGVLKLQYVDPNTNIYYVANAEVKLYHDGVEIASTTTNSEGWAVFDGLCTGNYVVNASHEGYAIKEATYEVTNGKTLTDKLEFVPVK